MIAIFLQNPSLTLSLDTISSIDCDDEPPLKGSDFSIRGVAND